MSKVLILGSTGMLGNAVAKHFLKSDHDVTLTYRNKDVSFGDKKVEYDCTRDTNLEWLFANQDFAINCIGTIKPFMASDPIAARHINSVLPWQMAKVANKVGCKMIHITTDCVFSGKKGKYIEADLHDALDDYGKTKSLGEPVSECMVIRTSIIGEEIHKNASLIAWAKSQKDKVVKGYTHHLWNGITTNEYGRVCQQIIEQCLYNKGLYHVHADGDVNKLQMMNYFNNKFNLNLTIEAASPGEPVDRTMRSTKELNSILKVASVEELINRI